MKSRLPEIEAKLGVVVQDAVKDAAERIAERAKVAAPVRTGELKASIDTRPGYGQTALSRTGVRYDVVAAWYWFLVEFGHGSTREGRGRKGGTGPAAPHPFMIPAAEAERPRLIAEVKKKLGDL